MQQPNRPNSARSSGGLEPSIAAMPKGHAHIRPARLTRVAAAASLVALLVLLAACGNLEAPGRPAGDALVGAYVPSGVWNDQAPLRSLETELGRRFDIAHWYASWDDAYDAHAVEGVLDSGRIPLISWQPHSESVTDIAAGRYDDLIRAYAEGVRSAAGVVYLRPFPEMNGDWVAWNGQPQAFVQAWRRMVDIFRASGAANVRWVWCPNATDQPRTAANRMEAYYPGDAYVDVLALDGYNWGATRDWSDWRSFEDIFAAPYARITALGRQPVWIGEVASAERGGNKGTWIRDMLDSRAFPRLTALVWFNVNKEADWRLESSSASLYAFRDWYAANRAN